MKYVVIYFGILTYSKFSSARCSYEFPFEIKNFRQSSESIHDAGWNPPECKNVKDTRILLQRIKLDSCSFYFGWLLRTIHPQWMKVGVFTSARWTNFNLQTQTCELFARIVAKWIMWEYKRYFTIRFDSEIFRKFTWISSFVCYISVI